MVVCNSWAAAESLADGNFERQTRNTKEEEGDEVWYLCDELVSMVIHPTQCLDRPPLTNHWSPKLL
jgi:hypothetical protein